MDLSEWSNKQTLFTAVLAGVSLSRHANRCKQYTDALDLDLPVCSVSLHLLDFLPPIGQISWSTNCRSIEHLVWVSLVSCSVGKI